MIPLPIDRYFTLADLIKEVQINNFFARSVIEKHVTGKIYVDDILNPKTCYVLHPYGISLLFGNHENQHFNQQFKSHALNLDKSRNNHEWMQTFPRDWDSVMAELFGDLLIKAAGNSANKTSGIIEMNSRVNFRFNREKYLQRKKPELASWDRIEETNSTYFEQMTGSVIPLKFWDSASAFAERGKGFTLLHKERIASTAYAAFVHEGILEIGIETVDGFRGHGFAELTCCTLIDYCLERDLIPVWSCRLENTASYLLAQKLGFEPTLQLPFYRLSN
jgi:RimJ/RimL family protein N-acetyltransferase